MSRSDSNLEKKSCVHRRGIFVSSFGMVFYVAIAHGAHAQKLDLSSYRETFSETFREKLDVTPWGPSRWIAHTPWNGDFGDAGFADPEPTFPFLTGTSGLKIIARKGPEGKWLAGLLSSADAKGRGFSQTGGYFEARMKLPPGQGVWPAFWLAGRGDDTYSTEIDVVEYYGQFNDSYRTAVHLWPKTAASEHQGQGNLIPVPANSLSDVFHEYGVEITDTEIVFYLDRHEVARKPAAPAMQSPMSILIDLALGSGWPIDETPDPSILEVDYVKAFKRS